MWAISFGAFLLTLVAIAGLVLGAVSIAMMNHGGTYKYSSLYHPLFVGTGGPVPTSTQSTTANGVTAHTLIAGSNDSSGGVTGSIANATGITTFTLTFGRAFSQAPTSVVVTPGAAFSNNAGGALATFTVLGVTTTGFVVELTKQATSTPVSGSALFYYMVV